MRLPGRLTAVVSAGLLLVIAAAGWLVYLLVPGRHWLTAALVGLILLAAAVPAVLGHRLATVRRRAEERFQALVHHSADCITVLDGTGRIVYDSPNVAAVLGFPPGTRLGMRGSELLHAADRAHAREVFAGVLAAPDGTATFQGRATHHDGSYRWMDVTLTNLLDQPAVRGVVLNAKDVSDSHHLREQLAFQATHDGLTGLPNRRMLSDKLAGSLRETPDRVPMAAVLVVDLDQFKSVNDSLGHRAGDELLRQVGARLGRCVRTQDLLARVGGDEFVALLEGVATRDEATAVAERIVTALRQPFQILGSPVTIGASVGVSFTSPGATVDEVLGDADTAMGRAKRSGGLRYSTSDT